MAKLSLNDMKYIIEEASKMVLNEITVKDAYARFYKGVPEFHYESIISLVQTGGEDFNENMVLSPESKWALAVYKKNPEQFLEDFYKLRNENGDGYLDIFMRAKERRIISGTEADLNQYKTISELGRFVNSLDYERIMGRTKGEQSNAINAAAQEADFPYEDERWKVVVPKSYEASCYWGSGTEWCTATRETDKWYNKYTIDGPLYILIDKKQGCKFQFHFPSAQFMNEEDYGIEEPVLETIEATDGLKKFFKDTEPENYLQFIYERICDTPSLYTGVFAEGEMLLNSKGEKIAGPFDYIGGFHCGLAQVESNSYYNYINTHGELMLDEWFASVTYSPSSDTFRASNNGDEHYLFTIDGKKVNKEPMKHISIPSNGLAAVIDMDGNANYMKLSDGSFIIFPEFESEVLKTTLPFLYQRGIVMNHQGYMNIVDKEGNFLCDEWYKRIEYLHKSITDNFKCFFSVENDGLYNCLNYQGNVMYDEWFVYPIRNWNGGYNGDIPWTDVKLRNGEWVRIDAMGNILDTTDIKENRKMYNNILNEIKVVDAAKKYYSDIDANDFMEIVTTVQGGNDTLLPETKWALGLYKKKSPRFMEDLYKLHNENGDGYLDIFVRAKNRRIISGTQADLNQYKSIAELGRFIGTLNVDDILGRTKGEMSNAVHDAKDDIEKLYEDDEWIVLIPKSHEASCYWANGAHWCTATRDDSSYYEEYSDEGPLFMNINKLNKEYSTQFHFETVSYMDYWDQEIDKPVFNNFPGGKKLNNFYKSYLSSNFYMEMIANELYCDTDDRYSYTYADREIYMVDKNLNPLAGPFIWMDTFKGTLAMGYTDNKYNLIDANGNVKFVCDYLMYHSDKCALGKKSYGYYLYDIRNEEERELPYMYVDTSFGRTGEPYFTVKKDKNKYNVIYGTDEREIIPEDVVNIHAHYDRLGYYFITEDEYGRKNVVKDGRFLFNKGYKYLSPMGYIFNEPIFKVATDDGKIAFEYINVHGKNVLDFTFLQDFKSYCNGAKRMLLLPNNIQVEVDADLNIINQTKSMSEGKLTPEDVKFIISETAKKVITEIKVIDAYSAYYKDIPEDIFQQIVSTIQGDNDTLLPTSKWYLGMYKKNQQEALSFLPNLRKEDGRGVLDTWERCIQRGVVVGQESNLANYKTLNDWADFTFTKAVDNNVWGRTKGEWSKAVNSAKNDIEKVYEDENWFVIIPKSMDASCYWGNDTEWCTATRNEKNNQFENYSYQGPLYININKQTGEKYQFHFETHSFMNSKDEPIQKPIMENINGVTDGLCDFYRELTTEDSISNFYLFDYTINDDTDWTWVDSMEEAVAVVKNKDKGCNFYTDSEGILSERWFDSVYRPDEAIHFAKVYHNGGYDIFNLKDKFLEFPAIQFDSIDDFESYQDLDIYYAKAYKNNKVTLIYYLMNHNGYLTWLGRWFDYMDGIDDSPYGYIAVKNDEMWAYINLDGEIVGDYYDGIWDWRNDYCKVENNGKYNFMDERGNLVSNTWFDECDDYVNLRGKVNVEIDGETYVYHPETGEIE